MTMPSPSHARQRDDADVDRVAVDRQRHAAVLRHALLGDVEVGHDLHARDDAGDHAARDRGRLAQHAVDAEAHAHVAALGLEVDVRGALLDRLGDDRVDELDDRRVVGGLADLGDVGELLLAVSIASATASSRRLIAADQAGDVVGRRHDRPHLVAGHQLEVVEREHVRRVGHRDQQRAVVVVADRDGAEAAGRLRR